jgi:glycine dehydrogenase subunit 1
MVYYISNIEKKEEMLKEIGLKKIEELFADIPDNVAIDKLNLPSGRSEMLVKNELKKILSNNKTTDEIASFIGAGMYDHYIPSAVRAITSRSEFYTSYTPYQAEISQGMLQALFEYQSMIVELTGMDVANASMYDGSTALAEAILLAIRHTGKKNIVIPRALHWEKKNVLLNYTKRYAVNIKEVSYNINDGKINLQQLKEIVDDEIACIYVENPNFFGVLDDNIVGVREIAKKALLVVGVNPLSLAILRSPSDYGADIVVGEGQVLGNPMNFGGPTLGIFACKEELVRKMPGRLIGATKDNNGKRAFCMVLQTREQHIRRDKATSNICSNEALCAVATAVYMSILGREGLEEIARINMWKAKKLSEEINKITGFKAPLFNSSHFNEFAVKLPIEPATLNKKLLNEGIQGGYSLKKYFPELGNSMILAATEKCTDENVNKLIVALKKIGGD